MLGHQDDPHGEHAEREQAHEEGQHDGGQHEYHLSARALVAPAVRAAGARVGHQVRGDHRVQHHQHEQRHHKERRDDGHEERYRPERVRLGQAHVHRGAVDVVHLRVFRDHRDRTANRTTCNATNKQTNQYAIVLHVRHGLRTRCKTPACCSACVVNDRTLVMVHYGCAR